MFLKRAAAILLFALPVFAQAQMTLSSSRIYGTGDKDIITPAHSSKPVSDPSAIQVIVEFLKGTGLTGWSGMTATGSILFSGDQTPYTASLSVLGGAKYRLDVVREAGTESTIFNRARGVFLSADGKQSSVSSDIASTGFVAFPRLLSAGYPAQSSIVTDDGFVTISGTITRRITLDDPSSDGTGSAWKTIDLYFDPATGHLLESVAPVHLSTADSAIYMLETTYADYKRFGAEASELPFSISQSLNGQSQWVLTLTHASTSTLPAASSFIF